MDLLFPERFFELQYRILLGAVGVAAAAVGALAGSWAEELGRRRPLHRQAAASALALLVVRRVLHAPAQGGALPLSRLSARGAGGRLLRRRTTEALLQAVRVETEQALLASRQLALRLDHPGVHDPCALQDLLHVHQLQCPPQRVDAR